MPRQRSGLLPTITLVGVTAAWGSTFFLIKILLEQISVLDFLTIRFAMATLFLFLLAPRSVFRLRRSDIRHGAILGLIYGVAQVLQTLGLDKTSASVSGFVTGMYVVLTPLFGALLFKDRVDRMVWIAVGCSTVGLAFLSLQGLQVSPGVALVFSSAMLYALHIIGLGRWSEAEKVFGLSIVQMAVITLVCTIVSAPNGISGPTDLNGWLALIYMALIAGALTILGQTWAQAHLPPTRAAIIMTMEPVWAAFFAVLFGGESLTSRMLIGGAFVVAAMLLVELAPGRKIDVEVTHLTV